ncbi:LacI family DNA-binding transcriptional regulator [Brachybacterium paraconglomeratum]|uniref:LacI family DNA-binding transcriptional regulator n=1 Tax=Brachybacterium paraconglomeratum TaxID=173362 RepID=UPI0031EFC1E4
MATMSDIAREAGVSLSTVSYALSGKRAISAATRERINAAITRLSYHPHAGARALASQRAGTIGLAVPLGADVDAHVVMMFVRSLMRAAHAASSEILLIAAEDHEATVRVLAEGKVDALVVMDVVEDDPRIPVLADAARPVVLLGYPSQSLGIPRVDFDFEQASTLAVAELQRRGARRLVMIGSPAATQTRHATYADRATRGFTDTCARLQLPARHLVHDHEVDSTGQLIRTILAEDRPDALVIHNESALPAIHRALSAEGVSMPSDLQVIVIAPRETTLLGAVEYTAVEIPVEEIGRIAVTTATDLIEGRVSPGDQLIEPTLIEGDTTHPPQV